MNRAGKGNKREKAGRMELHKSHFYRGNAEADKLFLPGINPSRRRMRPVLPGLASISERILILYAEPWRRRFAIDTTSGSAAAPTPGLADSLRVPADAGPLRSSASPGVASNVCVLIPLLQFTALYFLRMVSHSHWQRGAVQRETSGNAPSASRRLRAKEA